MVQAPPTNHTHLDGLNDLPEWQLCGQCVAMVDDGLGTPCQIESWRRGRREMVDNTTYTMELNREPHLDLYTGIQFIALFLGSLQHVQCRIKLKRIAHWETSQGSIGAHIDDSFITCYNVWLHS